MLYVKSETRRAGGVTTNVLTTSLPAFHHVTMTLLLRARLDEGHWHIILPRKIEILVLITKSKEGV